TFGWILFRAPNVSLAFDFMSHLCDKSILCFDNLIGKWPLVMCMGLMVVEWMQRDKQHVLQLSGKFFAKRWVRWILYVSIAMYALLVPCSQQDFIYFQF
ncbi:MAG: MBOAT family protein, partial [Muribaculaceae bacterium]|nr:MBOAT family protein [Muribaculaceae bacterium]